MKFLESIVAMWRYMHPVRVRVFITALLGGAGVCCSMLFVWLSKQLVDAATSGGEIRIFAIPFVATIVANIAINTTVGYLKGNNGIKLSAELRVRLFAKIMGSSWQGGDDLHSANMTNRLNDDVRIVVDTLTNSLPATIVAMMQFLAACIFMLILQRELAWLLLVIMPISVVVSRAFFKRMRVVSGEVRNAEASVQEHIQETIEHRVNISSFGQSSYTQRELEKRQKRVLSSEGKRINISSFSRTALNFGFMAGYATAFIWGVYELQAGAISFGMMTALLQLVAQIQNPVVNLSQRVPAFISAINSVERIDYIDKLPQQQDGDRVVLDGEVGIYIKGVSFRYSEKNRYIFKDFSHRFAPSTFTAITGETGAGKSTLIKLLLSIIEPESGSIELFNSSSHHPVEPALRANICYVPQGNTLISGTIRENLLLGNPLATDGEMMRVLRSACCDFVESLDQILMERGGGISEGQAQRIAIARAMLGRGSVMLLDEPTSSLDVDTEREFMNRLRAEVKGRTVIIITHREAVIKRCDELVKIERCSYE